MLIQRKIMQFKYKLLLVAILSIIGWCSTVPNVLAAEKQVGTFYMNSSYCEILGQSVSMERSAIYQNGTVYIPLKYLAQAVGVTAIRDDGKAIALYKGNKIVKVTKGKLGSIFVNGEEYKLLRQLVLPEYSSVQQTYADARMISKAFGYDVSWQGDDNCLKIWQGVPLAESDFMVAGIKVGKDSLKKVIGTLGNYQELSPPQTGMYTWRYATFPGIKAYFDQDDRNRSWQNTSVTIFSASIPTARGVKVGDSLDKVIELYGHGYSYDDKKNVYYYRSLSTYWLVKEVRFTVINDVVTEIQMTRKVVS